MTDIRFVNTQVQNGSAAEMTAKWSFPNNPTMPAGFTIDLPPELEGRNDTFEIVEADDPANPRDPDTPAPVIADCVATTTQLQCDLRPDYVAANPVGLNGGVRFWVMVTDSIDHEQEKTYVVDGQTTPPVTVTPGHQCGDNCDFEWNYGKYGAFNFEDSTILWYIPIAADQSGMRGGESIRVDDVVVGTNHEITQTDVYPQLMRTRTLGPNGAGEIRPTNWEVVPVGTSGFSRGGDGTWVEFRADAGYFYEVRMLTKIIGTPGGDYRNSARITVNDVIDGDVDGVVRYEQGGGEGIGSDVGIFTITKDVVGSATNMPEDQVFTGDYVVTLPTGGTETGEWSARDGETWESEEFPRNSQITVTEDVPTEPAAVRWASPTFSVNDFALPGGTRTPIVVTNTADVPTATFQASKVLTGDQGGIDRIPADATFQIDYSYPAAPGYEAGSGSLTLPRSGDVVTSAPLPVGAVLTLTEATPEEVKGVTWGTPSLAPSTLTIGDAAAASVTVTNPVTEQMGTFSVTKEIAGDVVNLPEDLVFTVDYEAELPLGEVRTGSFEVLAGQTWTSPSLPVGTIVTLSEIAPTAPASLTWATPEFTINEFEIAQEATSVTLTNTPSLREGTVNVRKLVDGSGANLVAATDTFTVTYSYPAGLGFAAGEGTLTVAADGEPVSTPALPMGAVVTFAEATPTEVEGARWVSAAFDVSVVIIGGDAAPTITLTNTLEVPPVPQTPPTPEAPPVPQEPVLPATGGVMHSGALAGAFLLLAGAWMLARRRQHASDAR